MTRPTKPKRQTNRNRLNTGGIIILSAAAMFMAVAGSTSYMSLWGFFLISLATAVSTFVFIESRSFMPFISGGPGFAMSLIWSGSAVNAVVCLSYIPLSVVFFLCVMKKYDRQKIIVAMSAVAVTMGVIAVLTANIVYFGALDLLKSEKFIDERVYSYVNVYNEYVKAVNSARQQQQNSSDGVMSDNESSIGLSTEEMTAYVQSIKALIPAGILVSAFTFCYITSLLFKLICTLTMKIFRRTKKLIVLNRKNWRISMSFISAIVFTLTLLLQLLAGTQSSDLMIIVTTNLLYILVPGFFAMGVYFLKDKIAERKRKGKGINIFLIIIVLLLGLYFLSTILMFVVFMGVYSVQVTGFKRLREDFKDKYGDDDF